MDLATPIHNHRKNMAPRHKNTILRVLAVPHANVREIDEKGRPLMAFRIVGKKGLEVIPSGVQVPYHSHYIAKLKEGSLLPMDIQTAKLAGVPFSIPKQNKDK